jgi:hypothetical protein
MAVKSGPEWGDGSGSRFVEFVVVGFLVLALIALVILLKYS